MATPWQPPKSAPRSRSSCVGFRALMTRIREYVPLEQRFVLLAARARNSALEELAITRSTHHERAIYVLFLPTAYRLLAQAARQTHC
jgi:hypothetical protein